jgi:DNA-binding MarR family transcriptional regulator
VSRKRELFDRLVAELRAAVGASARYDQAVASALGFNRTDTRCIDLLDREGRLTAGELAVRTSLTTGAITTVVDRLENAGYVCRAPDPEDRRRVYVQLTATAHKAAERFYSDHARRADQLYNRYTQEEVGLLLDFLRGVREFNEDKAAALEAQLLEAGSKERNRK